MHCLKKRGYVANREASNLKGWSGASALLVLGYQCHYGLIPFYLLYLLTNDFKAMANRKTVSVDTPREINLPRLAVHLVVVSLADAW